MMRIKTLALTLALCCSWHAVCVAQDWPAFRGADGLGTALPGGLLSKNSGVELNVRWKRELGSGYSSVVLAGNHVVTMFSDGDNDIVVCLDKSTGETIWMTIVGEAYKGENGSFEGPIATPLIYDQYVFALDPSGKLVGLNRETGQEIWSRHLVDDEGSRKPLYGFATSPVMAGNVLVLQTGVAEKSLAGIDPKTGEIIWAVSNDRIDSQTPVVMNFHGTDIVVAAGRQKLTGVDPANGHVLFEYEHKAGNGMAMVPVPLDDHRVVLTLDDSFSKAVSLRPGDTDKIEVSEEWQNRSIKNTYNVPALSNGNLFAYSTRILTCVDPETGKANWKSREPGDGFLITIDNHMIINTKQGSLHVSRANQSGYDEVASLDLFDDLCWSLPAYSDNAIFARSLSEIACVDIVAVEGLATSEAEEAMPMSPAFTEFVNRLAKETDTDARNAMVDEFLESRDSFPVVDGDIVHFVYRGEGTDVAVASDIFGTRQEKPMQQVEGTDFFYRSIRIEPDQRANYMFLIDYQTQTDTLNPRSATSSVYAGEMEFAVRLPNEEPLEMSWFAMPEWSEPEYLKDLPDSLNGTIVQHKVESETIEDGLTVDVYLPPGYDSDEDARFRTVFVFGGPGYKSNGKLEQTIDNVFSMPSTGVEPAIVVFLNVPPMPGIDKVIVDELLPSLDASFRTRPDRVNRTVGGFGFASGAALALATQHADQFSGVAVYSPLVFDAEQALIAEAVAKIAEPTEIYVEWGRFDLFNPHENWDVRDIGKIILDFCQNNEQVTVRGGMVNDSTDWSSWRNRYLEFLTVGGK